MVARNRFVRFRARILEKILRRLGIRSVTNAIDRYWIDLADAERRRAATGIEDIFYANTGRVVHKWIDYLPVYERFFAPLRGSNVHMLEIGVFKGGSLEMWRKYFGPEATIFGIDIDPACADLADPPNQVRIGSQDDPAFLSGVVSEMGRLDVVLDDGSHFADHQLASFRALWPLLEDGGLYIIEDMHTAYWPSHGGGLRTKGTAAWMAKTLLDDMNAWFHDGPEQLAPKDEIGAVCAFESMIVIEKRKKEPPGHIQIGAGV
ncbi:MAG: class I SAM-dependent methyltransferase [Methyloceanibacter sp.]|nr:class I SAM-dependent methyltransferase [Methyloceanibacter sp.]